MLYWMGERQSPFPKVGGLRKAPPKAKVLSGQTPPLPPLGKEQAGRRGSRGGRGRAPDPGPACSPESAGPPRSPRRVSETPPVPRLRAGRTRVKRGGSPPARSSGRTGMLSQDSDFLSKCLDFLKPAPSAAERDRTSRARRCGLLPSAHGRPPLPAPRSPPAPRLASAAAAAGGHSALGHSGPRPPPRPQLPARPVPAFRSESRARRAAGARARRLRRRRGAGAELAME